jgi:hypothetical protein
MPFQVVLVTPSPEPLASVAVFTGFLTQGCSLAVQRVQMSG